MSGTFWTSDEEKSLLNLYGGLHPDTAKEQAIRQHAEASGRTYNSVRIKLAELLSLAVPKSLHKSWNDPPIIEGDALVMGDLHIPYHDADFIEKCMRLAVMWNINQLIIGGDALDARAFSGWGEDFEEDNKVLASLQMIERLEGMAYDWPSEIRNQVSELLADVETETGNIGEELKQARAVLRAIDSRFERVTWIMGNHETWVLKTLRKALPAADLGRLLDVDNPCWSVSPYYWCKLISNGEIFQIEHPKNTAKGSSKRLSTKFNCHVIMLHNHHLSIQSDPSGRFLAIESGMCADRSKIQYDNQRHASNDEHMTGAVLVRNGKAWALNQFTDWEALGVV